MTSAEVSLQVRKLEEFFGKTLFTRGHNHIALTGAGMAVYGESAHAFDRLAGMTGRMLGQPAMRSLCVSVLPSLAERWLAPRLGPKLDALAGGGLHIRVEDDPVDLARDGIDLRLTYGAHFYPGAASVVLYQEQMAAVIAPTHAGAGMSVEALSERQFIHVEWGQHYHDHLGWNDWFAAIDLPRQIVPAKARAWQTPVWRWRLPSRVGVRRWCTPACQKSLSRKVTCNCCIPNNWLCRGRIVRSIASNRWNNQASLEYSMRCLSLPFRAEWSGMFRV